MFDCSKIKDMIYEYSGNDHGGENFMSLLDQIQISLHTLFCQNCARELQLYENARNILREDFFIKTPEPLSDGKLLSGSRLEDSIMKKIAAEDELSDTRECYATPGGISTRGWVIAGLIIIISLVTAFFGIDFKNLASESGMSFLLPIGITIGVVVTTYGALFIGSHLKELSERFGLS